MPKGFSRTGFLDEAVGFWAHIENYGFGRAGGTEPMQPMPGGRAEPMKPMKPMPGGREVRSAPQRPHAYDP